MSVIYLFTFIVVIVTYDNQIRTKFASQLSDAGQLQWVEYGLGLKKNPNSNYLCLVNVWQYYLAEYEQIVWPTITSQ